MISGNVLVPSGDAALDGDLMVPGRASGVVLFAHGSGSSRLSPRNLAVAAGLHGAGFGTLLLDLLTEDEEREDVVSGGAPLRHRPAGPASGGHRRLAGAAPGSGGLPVGLFGASTGAAAALAAADQPQRVSAVVPRGGRPDLAGDALPLVAVPVLLVVGGSDEAVFDLNRKAAEGLSVLHRIHVVPGATHLFPETGALEQVTEAAADWFHDHLTEEADDEPSS